MEQHEGRQRLLSSPGFRIARWTIPWIVLAVIVYAVLGLAGKFREATSARDATGTVDATASVGATVTPGTPPATDPQSQVPPAGTVAVALAEGILLRKDPSASGAVMDRLANGTQMTVLEETDTWLKVRDPQGRVGWIRNNENLVSVKKK